MQDSTFFTRLRDERRRLNLNQSDFGSIGGVTKETQSNYETGTRKPNSDYLEALSSHGVDVGFLFTGSRSVEHAADADASSQRGNPKRKLSGAAPAPDDEADTVWIPLFAAAGSMGPGSDVQVDEVILDKVPVSRRWLGLNLPRSRPDALRLVHAYGDSMGDTLRSGDFALVDTDRSFVDVDGVYVLEANDQLFIKRVTRRMDGSIDVSSDNPNVRTVDVLSGSHQVRICGRVVYGWNGRRF
ncbi:XRE family transcriptional regulator [Delftia tsuruhatensis]|uniref:XRE family transcriptional regulator n=1 Tax=Delftia tsuruhatensis TaxID=180282 RepID=UPI0020914102|nr:LexA family transcriptional regulator [Delftia tsuruhatensis]MCO5339262.1 LexA family transcriptional regulator [Delftia tsuruhatensis]MCR4546877.1 LexA family transcriptional regulator [Delftia tsuruhatensis]